MPIENGTNPIVTRPTAGVNRPYRRPVRTLLDDTYSTESPRCSLCGHDSLLLDPVREIAPYVCIRTDRCRERRHVRRIDPDTLRLWGALALYVAVLFLLLFVVPMAQR